MGPRCPAKQRLDSPELPKNLASLLREGPDISPVSAVPLHHQPDPGNAADRAEPRVHEPGITADWSSPTDKPAETSLRILAYKIHMSQLPDSYSF